MSATFIPNLLAILLFVVCAFISARAFYTYAQSQSPRLFILGLSMIILALTAAADFASSNITAVALNTDWFLYIGQAISWLFILLSFVRSSDSYFQKLMRVHVVASILALCLLFLSPTLPDFPNTLVRALLSGSRCVICFGILFYYISAFLSKQTRFSLLMSVAFLLLSFGYLLILEQYFAAGPNPSIFDNAGDVTRMVGFVTLLIALVGS
jgi:hypothetical protein